MYSSCMQQCLIEHRANEYNRVMTESEFFVYLFGFDMSCFNIHLHQLLQESETLLCTIIAKYN